jgi:flavorubredoxin
MNIVIIDGQGGQLGAQLIKEITAQFPNKRITAIGTNAVATAAMLIAGAKNAATGENPVIVACRKADVIIGPIGIVIADSLLGEVTEPMALAIAKADAVRILIPLNKCENLVAGVPNLNTGALIADAITKLNALISSEKA